MPLTVSKKRLAAIACLALAIVLVATFGPPLAAAASGWLAAGEPPVPSDLMVVVSGGAQERLFTAIELYRRGLSRAILVTSPTGSPEREMKMLIRAGVLPADLVYPPRPALSTREDALCIREVVLQRKPRSLLVITSPYHCRRLRLILERTLADQDLRLTVSPSRNLYWDNARWWADRQGWNVVPAEYIKLFWAWIAVPVVADVPTRQGPGDRKPLT